MWCARTGAIIVYKNETKIVYFEQNVAVYHNSFNFRCTLIKSEEYLDNKPLYNSQNFLRDGYYIFYRIKISNRVNFVILGHFFAFDGPKKDQIFISDNCDFYNL